MPDIEFVINEEGTSTFAICHGCNQTHTFVAATEANIIGSPREMAEVWARKHEQICELFLSEIPPPISALHEVKEEVTWVPDGYTRCESCNALIRMEDERCLNCGVKFVGSI